MDALTNLVNNIPDWQQKLDELNGKIAQRQIELAQLTENQTSDSGCAYPPSVAKSIRNKGSTESLKPAGEPAAHPREITPQPETAPQPAAIITTQPAKQNQNQQQNEPSSPSESQSPSAIQRQTNQARAAGQARARATLRKRQRSDSVASADGQAPKYRTRSMIVVYYDSYVQSFFEELVKFVSASRNMMRKAKMAAKVAQIKRLAELEMPDESEEEEDTNATSSADVAPAALAAQSAGATTIIAAAAPGDQVIEAGPDGNGENDIPALPFVSTRRAGPSMARTQNLIASRGMYSRAGARMSPYSRGGLSGSPGNLLGSAGDPPDVYDELDKGLEYVQSMCEHAAHQFLRDGDCAEEVANIQRRMGETRELADKEMERVKKEDPEGLKAAEESLRGRSYRPQSMRKVGAGTSSAGTALLAAKESASKEAAGKAAPSGQTNSAPPAASPAPAIIPAAPIAAATNGALEVDEGFEDMDYETFVPKLAYKSTRRMG